jgi:hypothetical protein
MLLFGSWQKNLYMNNLPKISLKEMQKQKKLP